MEDNSTTTSGSLVPTAVTMIANVSSAIADVVNLTASAITEAFSVETEKTTTPISKLKIAQPSMTTTTQIVKTTTIYPFDEFGPPEGIEYIFVPLGVMIFVIVLSAVVFIISRKRKMERLRHRLMPLYNFDPSEEGEDDWETELLDEGFSSRQRRYRTMDRADVRLFSKS